MVKIYQSYLVNKFNFISESRNLEKVESGIQELIKSCKENKAKIEDLSVFILDLYYSEGKKSGPEIKKSIGSLIKTQNYKNLTRSISQDSSLIMKNKITFKKSAFNYELSHDLKLYIKNFLDETMYYLPELKIQINSYNELRNEPSDSIVFDFYPLLKNNNENLENWQKVLLFVKKFRDRYTQSESKPNLIFRTYSTHQSIAFILGTILGSFTISCHQFNKNVSANELWNILPNIEELSFTDNWNIEKDEKSKENVIIILNISDNITAGVKKFLENNQINFSVWDISIRPFPSDNSILNNKDANIKLHSLLQFITYETKVNYIKNIHLFYKGPFSFYMFLGKGLRNKFNINLYQRMPHEDDFYFIGEL